jgi:hypothetical protein
LRGRASLPRRTDFDTFWNWWEQSQTSQAAKLLDGTATVVTSGASVVAASMRKKKVSRGATKQRAVTPESIFVVASGNNEAHRAQAELMDKIQECHESDFHHLEDAMIMRENALHFHEEWETAARNLFDENVSMKTLGWDREVVDAAKRSLAATLDDMLKSTPQGGESWSAASRMHAVSIRSFFHQMIVDAETTSSPSSKANRPTNADDVSAAAKKFVTESHHELEGMLDDEELELPGVIQVILSSLQHEKSFRQRKISALKERAQTLGETTPRRIRVAGLRSEAAEANGVYIADGLRQSFGRPIYVQHVLKERHHIFRLFYDMRHVKDEDELASSAPKWVDGQVQAAFSTRTRKNAHAGSLCIL